jgi:hypothetical protein
MCSRTKCTAVSMTPKESCFLIHPSARLVIVPRMAVSFSADSGVDWAVSQLYNKTLAPTVALVAYQHWSSTTFQEFRPQTRIFNTIATYSLLSVSLNHISDIAPKDTAAPSRHVLRGTYCLLNQGCLAGDFRKLILWTVT